eukprot:12204332-Heterocapsa_arctica.AAC.1
MLGKGQHRRTQELHLRHRQQSIAGAMEHDEEQCTVQTLDSTGEDRQAVRKPDGAECKISQGAEQIGSSENPTRQGSAFRTIEQ